MVVLYLWDGIESEGAVVWKIMHKDWSDVWLSKSFTHYFDALYSDYKNGRSEYIIWYYKFFEQPTVANVWNIGYRHPSKNPKAFDALVKLKDKPSWKSQSLISALNGLKELGDPRRVKIALAALVDIKSPRWWLAAPIWDYPIPACETVDCIRKS